MFELTTEVVGHSHQHVHDRRFAVVQVPSQHNVAHERGVPRQLVQVLDAVGVDGRLFLNVIEMLGAYRRNDGLFQWLVVLVCV